MEAQLQSALPFAEIEKNDFGEIKVMVPKEKFLKAAQTLYVSVRVLLGCQRG